MKSMSDTDFGSLCNIHSRHVSYLNILHVFVIVMDNLSDFVVFVLSKIVLHLGVQNHVYSVCDLWTEFSATFWFYVCTVCVSNS